MKALVLGGGGFLGSHVVDALLGEGYAVRIFEKESVKCDNIEHVLDKVELVEGDFTNETHLKEAVKGVDYIVHCISTTFPKGSNDNPAYDISSNLVSTLHLLDAAVAEKVKKVIFFSSGGTVYGIPEKSPIPEEHPTDPLVSYGIQKLAIEKYLKLYQHLYGLDYGIMRISNPYGERQRPLATQGAVTVFLYKALKNESIEIWGDGTVTRDYLYVTDVSRAVTKLLKYTGDTRLFNIGSGKGLSLLDIVSSIEAVIGTRLDVRYTPARPFDVPVNVLDTTRASTVLGWTPSVELSEGLALTVDYLKGLL